VFGHHGQQLRMDVAPFAHAARADEGVAQALFLLAVGELVAVDTGLGLLRVRRWMPVHAAPFLDPLPQLQRAHELGTFVVEGLVAFVGQLRLVQRPVAHVLAAERGGDHQYLGQRLVLACLQDHAAHARVQRQAAEFLADRCERVVVVHRAQFGQQRVTVGNRLARRRLDEGEGVHIAQAQRLHAQDHASQRTAQDLGVGETRPAVELVLAVQADADAVGHAPATPRALLRRGLADGLDLQLLDLAAPAVALHTRHAAVDDVADARHRERGLGDVGGQHDAPAIAGFENTVLFGLAQAREERQDLGRRPPLGVLQQVAAQVVGGLADLALAGQEDEDVARSAAPEFIHGVGDGVVEVKLAALFVGPPALLDREQPATDHDHRCGNQEPPSFALRALAAPRGGVARLEAALRRAGLASKVIGKAVGVDGGRGDDDLQVGPLRQQLLQVTEQEVDVQAAFVGLVDDEGVVSAQQRVALGLGEQDAVGHQLDAGAGLQPVLEAHLVAHHLAQRALQFVGNALGHAASGDAPRLRVADQPGAARAQAAAHLEQDLGQLRGLARAGLAADDHHLVLRDRARDFLAPGTDRQRLGVGDRRDGAGRHAGGAARARRGWGHGARIISAPAALRSWRRQSR